MILDEIVIRNVGVFRGEQRMLLRPPSKKKPIILVGGLNGAGKTTLLESLHLALFGKLASAGRMSGMSYEEYLRRLINRNTPGRDGASVEITFRVHEEGEYRSYHVRRSWAEKGKRVIETVEVRVDGEYDEVVSRTWQERVGRFIPHQMAHLFFFDGDRIEALADPGQSADLLRTAIDALLGVDLVDQLQTDIKALGRRKSKEKTKGPAREEIDTSEDQVRERVCRIQQLSQEQAKHQTEMDQAIHELSGVEKTYREQGGELSERQSGFEEQHKLLKIEREVLHQQLIALAARDVPLIMVKDLLASAMTQAETEHQQGSSFQLRNVIHAHLAKVLERLTERGVPKKYLEMVKKEFAVGFADENAIDNDSILHPLSAVGRSRLQTLLTHDLNEQRESASTMVNRYCKIEEQLESLERLLAAVPDSESLERLINHRSSLRQTIDDCRVRFEMLEQQVHDVKVQLERKQQKLDRIYEAERNALVANSDLERLQRYSDKMTRILGRFRERVTKKHTHRLEKLILESFQILLRKRGMIHSIEIEPSTCSVTLKNIDGKTMTPERLSMGERQLLAVAMLWGMAKASGRPLPVVIDTPLGRLDSEHRTNLVEQYFPNASHQVILLSTDEEIDPRYHERMKNQIGHMYCLEYDDETNGSVIRPGYFFEEAVV